MRLWFVSKLLSNMRLSVSIMLFTAWDTGNSSSAWALFCLLRPLLKIRPLITMIVKMSFLRAPWSVVRQKSSDIFHPVTEPRWASVNRGVLVCDECCSIHRGLGRHSSQVRHLTHSPWPPSQLQVRTCTFESNRTCTFSNLILQLETRKTIWFQWVYFCFLLTSRWSRLFMAMVLIPSGSTASWTRPPLLVGSGKQTPRTECSKCLYSPPRDLPVSSQIFSQCLHIIPLTTKPKCSDWLSAWRSVNMQNSTTRISCNHIKVMKFSSEMIWTDLLYCFEFFFFLNVIFLWQPSRKFPPQASGSLTQNNRNKWEMFGSRPHPLPGGNSVWPAGAVRINSQ